MSTQGRSRLQLILLALLFASPVIGAWFAWTLAITDGVDSTTNAGELIQPARPLQGTSWLSADGEALPTNLLSQRWNYVLLGGDGCDAQCVERLHLTRQLRISVNKDMSRIQRVLLVKQLPAEWTLLQAEHPDLIVAVLGESDWQTFVAQFVVGKQAPAGAFYLVDPLGNLMMRYQPGVTFKGMLKDLQKVLKASRVG